MTLSNIYRFCIQYLYNYLNYIKIMSQRMKFIRIFKFLDSSSYTVSKHQLLALFSIMKNTNYRRSKVKVKFVHRAKYHLKTNKTNLKFGCV